MERAAGASSAKPAKNLCWYCENESTAGPFCEHCAKIQPAGPGMDYFQFMGLQRRLQIDLNDLQRRFYALSRKFHPDYYHNSGEYEQGLSLENSATLNQAYRALREPFARAEYLVRLFQGSDKEISASPPHELLEEVFEFNERLQEFRTISQGERAKSLATELENDRRTFEEKDAALRAALEELFRRWDAASDAREDTAELLEELRALLSQRKYIQNAVRDITEALGCLT
ncbi:MAG: Fe-S protein assembly co-chaperone HscB [Nitrospinota bacterium]